jgi:hypothetical protein
MLAEILQPSFGISPVFARTFDPPERPPLLAPDLQEFTIETILNHRGDKKKRSTLEFEVKWLGYPDSYNSWEPWSNLRGTDALHLYLRTHGMASLIPTRFRT